ncbi:MAG: hypothetical protein ABI165_15670 [Bryobacteraceae bacterium]
MPLGPPVVRASSGVPGWMKILMVVIVVFGLLAVAAGAAIYYAYHRAKAFAHRNGIDSVIEQVQNAAKEPAAGTPVHSIPANLCSKLSNQEAANLLGEPIDHNMNAAGNCQYFGPAGLSEQLAKQGMARVTSGQDASPVAGADAATKLLGALATLSQTGKDAPLLTVSYSADGGRAAMASYGIMNNGMGRAFQGASSEIPNLGDKAYQIGNLGLNVFKDDSHLNIFVGPVPDANTKAVAIARVMLPRL